MEPARLNRAAFAREFVQQRRSVIRVELCKAHLTAQDVGKNDVCLLLKHAVKCGSLFLAPSVCVFFGLCMKYLGNC